MRPVRIVAVFAALVSVAATARFPLPTSGVALTRGLTTGAFFDVIGRKSAAFGYEGRPLEVWVYPLKVVDDLQFSFRAEGYPVAVPENELPGTIEGRPEATILTRSHAAFTVREIVFAPIDEGALVILLDIDSVLPVTVIGSFRPSLRPMWPAAAATANAGWDATAQARAVRGQRPVRRTNQRPRRHGPFRDAVSGGAARRAARVHDRRDAGSRAPRADSDRHHRGDRRTRRGRAASDRIAADVAGAPEDRCALTHRSSNRPRAIETPDPRINRALQWAIVGMDKGFATNPALGTGLVAGFRTSGNSERPGFAWFFGRDALWTSLALNASGRTADARIALEFLAKYQRDDGRSRMRFRRARRC
jgi:hypothetical protein